MRKRLKEGMAARKVGGRDLPATPPAKAVALPVITYADGLTVHLNGEDIRVIHLPPGHTDGDSVVIFTQSNVVHMGDDFVTYGFPFVDVASGGSVVGLVADLETIIPQLPKDAKVIPGHGTPSTVDDVKKFAAALKEMVAAVESLVKKGKSLEAIKKDKPLAKWASTWGGGFIKADAFVELIYADLQMRRTR